MNKLLVTTLIACFSGNALANVIIDTKNVDQEQYHADMYECQQYVQQVQRGENKTLGSNIIGSTVKGAALGAAGSAIAGGSGSSGAKVGASIGLIGGALKHGSQKRHEVAEYQSEQEQVVRQCMKGRGYHILN
jgi:hypothetical protein